MTDEQPTASYCPKAPMGDSHGPGDKYGRCSYCGFCSRYEFIVRPRTMYKAGSPKSEDDDYDMQWNPDYDGGELNSGTARSSHLLGEL